jgi:hypothetical protein
MTIGAGYLDVAAALANKDLANGTAMSPTASYDASTGNVYLTYDPSSIWDSSNLYGEREVGSASTIWSTQTVWGTLVVDAKRTVWGSRAVWGSNTVSGFQAIWSDRGVWGSRAVWGSSDDQASRGVWGSSLKTSDSNTDFYVQPR